MVLIRMPMIDPSHLYVIEAWMGFLPNLMVAEYLIRGYLTQNWPSGEKGIRPPPP
jgi:hypothetical protein